MIFDGLKGKAKRDEDADEGASNRPIKKKNKQWCEDLLMATADRKGGRKPVEGTPDHFEKLLEGPRPNHSFPIKHLYKDCGLMKWFLSGGFNREGAWEGPQADHGCHRGDEQWLSNTR